MGGLELADLAHQAGLLSPKRSRAQAVAAVMASPARAFSI